MFSYITVLFWAILGKPTVITKVEQVYTPFNREQINELEKIFPIPVYNKEMTIVDMAHATGKYEVVQYIKRWSAKGGVHD